MLSQKYLHECFDYNPDSGNLTWKARPREHFASKKNHSVFNGKFAGEIAGCCGKNLAQGIRIGINKKMYQAGRIIWVYCHGSINHDLQIDHVSGDATNNSLSNLRLVTQQENLKNQRIRSANTTGIIGVSVMENGTFRVKISSSPQIHIGVYKDFFEACCARKSAEIKHGYHTNHGSR